MKSIMEACNLAYRYPGAGAPALQGLTMRIPEGTKTAICGHNGSGKSTFFLHAIGIHRPAEGVLEWKGSALSYHRDELARLRQRIGLVFQDPEQQLIWNTPYEDISYGLRNAKVPEREIASRTQQILDTMELRHLADTPLHHLSLGQKKRVALAGVLVLQPDLLLLDEPTAYLDRLSEQQLIGELDRIHNSGVTVVMATHDMNLAYSWADWILVMDQGRCVMEGSPYDVYMDEARLGPLGLEQPLLLQAWRALPESMRHGKLPPRSIAEWKAVMMLMEA